MKPQDILVLLKICVMAEDKWSIAALAKSISMSASEVHAAIKRLENAGLLFSRKPKTASAEEFIIHGLKYVFPAVIGRECRGIPTAHSASPLSKLVVSDPKDMLVWPYEFGNARGQSVNPLYKSVPLAVKNDFKLYELLALADAIRTGRAREREIAVSELKKYIRPAK
jgi:DNA-binding Lrp family transcriptional regulator